MSCLINWIPTDRPLVRTATINGFTISREPYRVNSYYYSIFRDADQVNVFRGELSAPMFAQLAIEIRAHGQTALDNLYNQ